MSPTKFSQAAFDQFIVQHGIVGFFPQPIKLVSGRESCWYVNWRTIASDVFLIDQLSDFVLQFVAAQGIEVDCYYGTPDGATKLAVLCQYKFASAQPDFVEGKYPLAMGRKTPKDHGQPQDRFFVGAPRGKVIIMEDVTTTGGSLFKSVKQLQEAGVEIVASLALTDRDENMDDGRHVRDALADLGVRHLAMSHAVDLLPQVVAQQGISDELRTSIHAEFTRYSSVMPQL